MTLGKPSDSLESLMALARVASNRLEEIPADFVGKGAKLWMPLCDDTPAWMFCTCKKALALSLTLVLLSLGILNGWQPDLHVVKESALTDSIVMGALLP